MPLSRSNRIDRRRRVMLDAVAADSEFAVESVRAKKRLRARDVDDDEDEYAVATKYRDPGYSQAVRKTCQQRMVQLIPVRRGTMSMVLTAMWLMWAGLIVSHYYIFARPDSATQTGGGHSSFASLPIAQLFHLRSAHSIAQWLTCQLWLLTAFASWMIFQLRRHKLDDYRARYRIWVVLAIAAAFCCFEASTSGLLLLGMSIDGWAKKEIGYAGFPLVLATFASIIGVLGIRLCSELKSSPMSVASWLGGLFAWGLAAMLGNNLLKITWSQGTIDLVVGSFYFGGILAVFQAAGIYLRQTYIQAQKRFLVRNGANLAPIQWKVPKISLRRTRSTDDMMEQDDAPESTGKSRWKMPWKRSKVGVEDDSAHDVDRDMDSSERAKKVPFSKTGRTKESSNRTPEPVAMKGVDRELGRAADRSAEHDRDREESPATSPKAKGRLFGFIPNRREQNEKLDADPIREDDGPAEDRGLTKKRGWFGIGGNRDAERDREGQSPNAAASSKKESHSSNQQTASEKSDAKPQSSKRAFWSRKSSAESDTPKAKPEAQPNSSAADKTMRGWISKFSKSNQPVEAKSSDDRNEKSHVAAAKSVQAKPTQDPNSKDAESKKSWLAFASKKPKDPQPPKVEAKKADKGGENDTAKSGRRGLFGLLDGLKLKPPTDEPVKSNGSSPTKPVPIKQGQSIPSTQSDNEDEDYDDEHVGRPMSKADRKKLRRQNQDDRRIA